MEETTTKDIVETIEFGDKVKSFDFESVDDCYYEGLVTGFGMVEGCQRYTVRVSKKVWKGGEIDSPVKFIYPPVNGTPSWDGETNCVKKII